MKYSNLCFLVVEVFVIVEDKLDASPFSYVNTFFAKANYLSKFRLSRVTKYFLVGGVLESYFRYLYM